MKEIKRQAKDAASVITLGASNKAEQELEKLTPDIPKPEEVEPAPVADDASLKIANRRKAAKRRSGGRAGTVLTEGSTIG